MRDQESTSNYSLNWLFDDPFEMNRRETLKTEVLSSNDKCIIFQLCCFTSNHKVGDSWSEYLRSNSRNCSIEIACADEPRPFC